jgi:signal transduction histidine kinase
MAAAPVLLAMILAAVYVSRTITKPIRTLSAQIEGQAADGEHGSQDFGERSQAASGLNGESAMPLRDVDLDAPRELADLARTFNRMLGRLRDTQQRLLDTERLAAVGKMAASVAHEVRNPLAGIRMNLQLLQQHQAREGRSDESLTIALAELERLDGIVQEMLILGRKAQPRPEPIDLHDVAQDVLQLLDRRLHHANVQASLEGESTPVKADAGQIKQVLLNLIINATDAMPQGGRLIIRTTARDGHGRVEVEDTGPGIDLDHGEDPFAWFSTTKSAGSGIGLAVCKQIIEAHAGKIALEKMEAGGTRAWIELTP